MFVTIGQTRLNVGVTERCKCCSLSACISGWIEEKNKLSGSFSFPLTGQEEERRGGLKNRLQCWGSVRPLSCQKNEKEKRKIRLLWNSIFTQTHTWTLATHTQKHTCCTHSILIICQDASLYQLFVFMWVCDSRQRPSLSQSELQILDVSVWRVECSQSRLHSDERCWTNKHFPTPPTVSCKRGSK